MSKSDSYKCHSPYSNPRSSDIKNREKCIVFQRSTNSEKQKQTSRVKNVQKGGGIKRHSYSLPFQHILDPLCQEELGYPDTPGVRLYRDSNREACIGNRDSNRGGDLEVGDLLDN